MDIDNLRWWGWGTLDRGYDLEGRPAFWPTLQRWLDLPDELVARAPVRGAPPISLDEVSLRPSRLDDPVLVSLRRLMGEEAVRVDKLARVEHACGKSYCDLVRVRAGLVPNPPDAVVYPADPCQVACLLAWASERGIAVIPFGGGSTVLGGVEPPPGDQPAITLDLARLDRVLAIDPLSRTARIQAGAIGPEVEAQLNAQGFTLGHFPHSFEFSTLGGWIATRSAGQNAIGYGKIEDMTQAVQAVTPAGAIETKDVPASAAGPDLLHVLLGSEGAYGVITEATMCIHPLPAVQDYRGVLFRGMEDGVAALREMVQSADLRPSIARLSDAAETAAYVALSHERHGLRRLIDEAVRRYLKGKGYDPASGSVMMLLGFDGGAAWTARQWDGALEVCGDHGGFLLGRAVGRTWVRERYAQPYLRDVLLDHGLMVDALETATSWSNLACLSQAMVSALKGAVKRGCGFSCYVMIHISHACRHGASLRLTFMCRQVADPDPEVLQTQWQRIMQVATDVVVATGGALTHHHGIGRGRLAWLDQEIGPVGVEALRALKRTFDPADVMNPGILLPT